MKLIAIARRWLIAASHGGPLDPANPVKQVERSLEVAVGLRAPGQDWAHGQTWRDLYPALVTRLGGDGMTDRQWPRFRRLAMEMERVAFGPPAVNAAKLLALIDARRLQLTHIAGARIYSVGSAAFIHTGITAQPVHAIVDSVLRGPGPPSSGHGLLGQLVRDGYARVLPGRRGLDVAPDASCVAGDGRSTLGLSAAGRPTEDAVIGNDTLDRALHPQLDRWAMRVAARVVPPAMPAAPVLVATDGSS